MDSSSLLDRIKRIELISTRLVENLLAGNYRSVFRGVGMEFDEVREYVPGDDVRLIDWNVTSRMGTPFTKLFREERELSLFHVVDVSASLFNGSGDVAKDRLSLTIFAILAFSAVVNNDRVGAVLFTDRIEKWVTPAKGKKHALRLLNDLVSCRPEGRGSDLALALRTVAESLKRRGICVIVSDFKTSNYWDELSHLARRHDVIALKITDPPDHDFPSSGTLELEDPETGEVILGEGVSRAFRKQYRSHWEHLHVQWRTGCHRRGVETLEISTADDPGVKLVQFFEKRKRR